MHRLNPIERILSTAAPVEFDYVWLMSQLKGYASPRDVVTRLLQQGVIVRVKKGLYVLGDGYRQRPISLELLANMIFGPSYISREYALHYYGLIPEGVNEITSMTTKRNKYFTTPVGHFSYCYLNSDKYPIGIQLIEVSNHQQALMAIPEKALADYIFARKEQITDSDDLKKVLLEDYRLDPTQLGELDCHIMEKIAFHYKHKTINLLPNIIRMVNHEK